MRGLLRLGLRHASLPVLLVSRIRAKNVCAFGWGLGLTTVECASDFRLWPCIVDQPSLATCQQATENDNFLDQDEEELGPFETNVRAPKDAMAPNRAHDV